jgi:hypothetical protein
MTNKKGIVIGRAIATFVTLIVVFLIMGTFVTLSFGISTLKKPLLPQSNLFMQAITVSIDGKTETVSVLQAYIFYENGKTEESDFIEQLKKILTPSSPCLVLAKSENENPVGETGVDAIDDVYIRKEKDGNFFIGNEGNTPQISLEYKKASALAKTSFINSKDKKIYVEYYWGRCIDE